MEENPCGKRKRKGKRWRAAYSGARRSSAFQIGRPSQDFHAALRCTRPLPSPSPTGVACLTDGIQYDGISVVDRRPTCAELARAEALPAFRLEPTRGTSAIFSPELTNGPDSFQRTRDRFPPIRKVDLKDDENLPCRLR